jgi:hypothetical protein
MLIKCDLHKLPWSCSIHHRQTTSSDYNAAAQCIVQVLPGFCSQLYLCEGITGRTGRVVKGALS